MCQCIIIVKPANLYVVQSHILIYVYTYFKKIKKKFQKNYQLQSKNCINAHLNTFNSDSVKSITFRVHFGHFFERIRNFQKHLLCSIEFLTNFSYLLLESSSICNSASGSRPSSTNFTNPSVDVILAL